MTMHPSDPHGLPRAVADEALRRLRSDEGVRRTPYDDRTGRPVRAPSGGRVTIGVGINLDAGLDDEEVDWLERHRLYREWRAFSHGVTTLSPGLEPGRLPAPCLLALALMAFQLGASSALEFHGMFAAVRRNDWPGAAREALCSKWYRQTPRRADEVARLLVSCGAAGPG